MSHKKSTTAHRGVIEVTSRPDRRGRKRAQLLNQVAQSIQFFLADIEEDDLCLLTYSHAEPIGTGDHIRIIMLAPRAQEDEEPVDLQAFQQKLDAYADEARMEVAHDINRRRAPLISFLVIPEG